MGGGTPEKRVTIKMGAGTPNLGMGNWGEKSPHDLLTPATGKGPGVGKERRVPPQRGGKRWSTHGGTHGGLTKSTDGGKREVFEPPGGGQRSWFLFCVRLVGIFLNTEGRAGGERKGRGKGSRIREKEDDKRMREAFDQVQRREAS